MADGPGIQVPPIQVAPQNAQETTPLIANANNANHDLESDGSNASEEEEAKPVSGRSVLGLISVLLIGVFLSQADITLVLATYTHISSEFHSLNNGSWIITSFGLATCVTQPMYGKFSDIFGRKAVLQTSYILFLIGTLITGLSKNMAQMIFGRVIQGAGGAGMVSVVSILLTDLVPLQEVAAYRSYVNVFSTVGRSCGGLIGGYLTQSIGWRWAFLCQCPLVLLSIILVWWKLEEPPHKNGHLEQNISTKLKRIDFVGIFFMSVTILSLMLAVDLGGKKVGWNTPIILVLFLVTLVSGIFFVLTETYWAKEPVFPLRLLGQHAVITSYSILYIQTTIQVALMFLVPLYFQVTANASMGEAGAHLIPAILGNTVGGLGVGAYIKRTGRYKPPTIISSLLAIFCFSLLITCWRGHTNPFESLFIFFGGFATGMANSTIFVGLTAGVKKEDVAIAASGLYLCVNIGAVTGVSGAAAFFQSALQSNLRRFLSKVPDGPEIAAKVLSDVKYVQSLHGSLRRLVIHAFVASFQRTFALQIALASLALVIGIISRQKKITH